MKDTPIISAEELEKVAGGTSDTVSYYACAFSRRGDLISSDRHWFGPYGDDESAVNAAKSGYPGVGYCEIHVYQKAANGQMTFLRKTYVCL